MEDKQKILDSLLMAIRQTRAGEDVSYLEYIREGANREEVHVFFGDNGYPGRVINVAMDSGIAMIRDVLNHISIG